jgi:hypothetical protein
MCRSYPGSYGNSYLAVFLLAIFLHLIIFFRHLFDGSFFRTYVTIGLLYHYR